MIRFFDTALDSSSLVGDFRWSAVETEIFTAVEMRIPTATGELYRIETRSTSSPETWDAIGSLLGNGR